MVLRFCAGALLLLGLGDAAPVLARTTVAPYLEVGQVVTDEFSAGHDVLTYSLAAVGAELRATGRRTSLTASYRYEHRLTWDHARAQESRSSGALRGQWAAIPGWLNLEAGALASRARINPQGLADVSPFGKGRNTGQIYALYAGPSLARSMGAVDIQAAYRIGYSKLDQGRGPGNSLTYDQSIDQDASASLGMRPGLLPFGWTISADYRRSNQDLLDLRYDQGFVRADLILPVTAALALTGGGGVQRVQARSRPLLLDTTGRPVLAENGQVQVDPNQPRRLTYDLDDLFWDVGLTWAPSARVRLEVRTGRTYGSQTYQAALRWQSSPSSFVQAELTDEVDSFGQELGRGLAQIPTQFQIGRNSFSGPGQGCAFSFGQYSPCLNQTLGSGVSGALYRNRGGSLSWTRQSGRASLGFGLGYRHRHFIAPLAGLPQSHSKSGYAQAQLGYELAPRTRLSSDLTVSVFDDARPGSNRQSAISFDTALTHDFSRALSGNLGVGLDAIDSQDDTQFFGNAAASLRYRF